MNTMFLYFRVFRSKLLKLIIVILDLRDLNYSSITALYMHTIQTKLILNKLIIAFFVILKRILLNSNPIWKTNVFLYKNHWHIYWNATYLYIIISWNFINESTFVMFSFEICCVKLSKHYGLLNLTNKLFINNSDFYFSCTKK